MDTEHLNIHFGFVATDSDFIIKWIEKNLKSDKSPFNEKRNSGTIWWNFFYFGLNDYFFFFGLLM